MKMYSYTKRRIKTKRLFILTLSFLLIFTVGIMSWQFSKKEGETPQQGQEQSVFQEEEVPVLALPDSEKEEKAIRPYKVNAEIALQYYDENSDKADDVTLFEGKYRANEGVSYVYNNEEFEVLSIFSGEVSEVKDDPLFGKSITIQSENLSITYQSLKEVKLAVGDKVNQGDVLSSASTNIYHKDLQNHLYLVVALNGKLMNPETIYEKTLSEIK